MALFADATALKALGLLGHLDLLQHYATDVVIPPSFRYELRMIGSGIAAAVDAGWMRTAEPSNSVVQQLVRTLGIDEGEAEVFDLVSQMGTSADQVLIDEGLAFEKLHSRAKRPPMICLADVLTALENSGHLESASDAMQRALDSGYYKWARKVRADYEKRCQIAKIAPLSAHPTTPRD